MAAQGSASVVSVRLAENEKRAPSAKGIFVLLLTYYGDTTSTSNSFFGQGEVIFDNAIIIVIVKIKAQ